MTLMIHVNLLRKMFPWGGGVGINGELFRNARRWWSFHADVLQHILGYSVLSLQYKLILFLFNASSKIIGKNVICSFENW